MGSINLDNTGSGGPITLTSDGTYLYKDSTKVLDSSTIVDNLNSDVVDVPLSAAQGKALKLLIDALNNNDYIDRADKILAKFDIISINYGDGINILKLLSTDTIPQPDGKIAYVMYDNTDSLNNAMESMVYDSNGKLIRIDHYIDETLYDGVDTSRSGYTQLIYNATTNKFESSTYYDVALTEKGVN